MSMVAKVELTEKGCVVKVEGSMSMGRNTRPPVPQCQPPTASEGALHISVTPMYLSPTFQGCSNIDEHTLADQ